ncbi:hypothetical protein GTR02_18415 [Kineococcus sp. R8]|uniref:beta-1,6-N-acetylglucosaminyltransferase n=1 Tax=Kineococcus siccus TaxID=2696567 RepID=UPI0014134AE4|nr:hypothetical protein [Kineococcus siccus]
MQVTYLVLVHQQPRQLAALLDLLVADGDRALVHVDARAGDEEFRVATAHLADRVRFTRDRHRVTWGGFGAVAATTSALRQAVAEVPGDYYALVSGADLPIKPVAALHAELASGAVYMSCNPMPSPETGKPMSRLERWNLTSARPHSRLVYRLNRHVVHRLPRRDVRRALGGARPHAGSQWWLVPHACAEELLAFIDRSPRFVRFFHHAQVPDEMFFQTVLMALPHAYDVRGNLTHTRWTGDLAGRTSPATLHVEDLGELARSPRYFARKFDHAADPAVYEAVRTQLLAR